MILLHLNLWFCVILCFLCYKAELQKQQQQFVAQKLIAAQRHVAVTQQPQPQKATIVYRSQPVPTAEQPVSKTGVEVRQRSSRSGRHHDGTRYTSGKHFFAWFSHHFAWFDKFRAHIWGVSWLHFHFYHRNHILNKQKNKKTFLTQWNFPFLDFFLLSFYNFSWLRIINDPFILTLCVYK